jgi:hypothetical protein
MKLTNINKNYSDGISIAWIISAVIGLSVLMVITSFMMFIRTGGAYNTVKQISAASNTLQKNDLEGYDTTSPVRADTLGAYMKIVDDKVMNFDDEVEFKLDILDKRDLGY